MTVTLEVSYAECKRLNRRYGTTYYWSTMVLPSVKRPHVHALYGFCRHADDIVDATGDVGVERRGAALADLRDRFFNDLERGHSDDLVLKAVVHTVRAFDIDPEGFSPLPALDGDGSDGRALRDLGGPAGIHGWLRRRDRGDDAADPRAGGSVGGDRPRPRLGEAFQLTNFLRDVDEDLDRGRQYLPQEDLRRFCVDLAARRCTPSFVELMRFEIARCRELYRCAEVGIALLPDRSARCIRAAHDLYGRILDRIEAQGYDVFAARARVSTPRKLAVAARHLTGRVRA